MSSSSSNIQNQQVIDFASKYGGRFPPPYNTTYSTSNKYNELTVPANELLYNDETLDTYIIIIPRPVYLDPSTNEVHHRYNAIFRRLREMSIGCGHNFKDIKINVPMYIHILVKGYDMNRVKNFDMCYGTVGRQNFYINYESNILYQLSVKNICDQFADVYNSFIYSRSSVDLLVDPLRSFFITMSGKIDNAPISGIYDVCTSVTSRRKGYLSILLQDLISNCGYDNFFLTVDLANPSFLDVCRQYIRLGFIKPIIIEKDVVFKTIPLKTKQVLLTLFKKVDNINQTIKDETNIIVSRYLSSMSSVKFVGYTKINFRIPSITCDNFFNLFINGKINNDIIRKEVGGAFVATGLSHDNKIILDISSSQIISGSINAVQGYNNFVYTEDEYKNKESIQQKEYINIFNSDYNYAHLSTGRKTPYINFHTHYRALEHIYYKNEILCFLAPSSGDLIFSINGILLGGLLAHVLFIDIGLFVIRLNSEFKNMIQCIVSTYPESYNTIINFIKNMYENEVRNIPNFSKGKGIAEKFISNEINLKKSEIPNIRPEEIVSKEECIRYYDTMMNTKFTFSELKKYIETNGTDKDRLTINLICRDEIWKNIQLFNITFHKYGPDIDFDVETSTNYDSNEYIYNMLKQGEFITENTLNLVRSKGKNPQQIIFEKYNENIGVV